MTEDSLVTSEDRPLGWYEVVIPVRGCQLSLDDIKAVYRELLQINRNFGEQVIAKLPRNTDMTDEQWDANKIFLLNDAFCLTTTVSGLRDQQLYGETEDIFNNPNLPSPIKSIYFTNINSFGRHTTNGDTPRNQVSVHLDFSKPELFDASPLVSAATPNNGNVTVKAEDVTFYNAVQKTIESKLTSRKTWYGAIHGNFSYDIGMWFIAFPAALYFSAYYMDQIISSESKFEVFRWPLFIYLSGLSLLSYRALTAYVKWAFPVNILKENNDRALRHRVVLGGFASWLLYKLGSTVYGIIVV